MKIKKYLPLIFLLLIQNSFAQNFSGRISKLNIKLLNNIQLWDINESNNLYQISNQLRINYLPNRNTSININSSYAASEVQTKKLNGLTDLQIQLSQKVKSINTVFEAGVSLPTGKASLTNSEFASTVLLSRNVFNFRNPVLGQGTNIFLGATWAELVGDNFVFGAGLSYQIRGEYEPYEKQDTKYKPSNELLVSAGVDYRIDKAKSLSADLVGIFFNEDEVDGNVVFTAGNRFIYSLGYRQYFSNNVLRINARYRYSAEDELQNLVAVTNEKFTSNYFMLAFTFYHSVSRLVSIQYNFNAKFFEETLKLFSGYSSFSPGIIFYFEVSSQFEIPLHVKYILGSKEGSTINGVDTGIGINLKF
ncbi:MAG: hypothetical protein HND52_02450 [Ignavibacteriae bacterium]|nr:hypothetical protein [Ignavibacteriota bacterium]NOG96810.1 hypothetical protein [Ignavibacteriota bacterium]